MNRLKCPTGTMSKIHEYGMRYHEETAIDRFLRRLEVDLDQGRHIRALPETLARAMLANVGDSNLTEEIDVEVAL